MATFFRSGVPLINLRVNNRTHRKLVVSDGTIGYIGGFNVGDEYLGENPDSATGATPTCGSPAAPSPVSNDGC